MYPVDSRDMTTMAACLALVDLLSNALQQLDCASSAVRSRGGLRDAVVHLDAALQQLAGAHHVYPAEQISALIATAEHADSVHRVGLPAGGRP